MSEDNCKYHPDSPASWYCGRCDINFCMSCIPDNNTASFPRCTLCRTHLEPMGISKVITPFWYKIGHFFIYPLSPTLLVFNLIFSALFIFFSTSLFGVVFFLAWSAFVLKVYFSVMEYTSYGHLDSPNWNGMMQTRNRWVFIKLILMLIIVGSTIYKAAQINWILAISLSSFFVLSYPAINMILCMDKSIFSAVNPMRIINVMVAIGWSYWVLLIMIVLLSFSSGYATDFAMSEFSNEIGLPMGMFISIYFSLVMYHMFGYVMYQYHYELGHSVLNQTLHKNIASHGKHTSEFVSEHDKTLVQNHSLNEIEIYIQEGRYEDAEQMLQDIVKNSDNNEAFERLIKLYLIQGKIKFAVQLTNQHLKLLNEKRQFNLMRMAYTLVVKSDPEYVPESPEIIHALINILNRKEDVKQAFVLVNVLRKNHVDYPGVADACFTFAKLIVEKMNKREEAARIIQWALNVAKDSEKVTMQTYLKMLQ